MAPFKFEVNWMFNGVDMTSQTYTHFIWAHMGDLVGRRLQCKSLIWAYIKCVYVCEVISIPLSIQFASNLKRSPHT